MHESPICNNTYSTIDHKVDDFITIKLPQHDMKTNEMPVTDAGFGTTDLIDQFGGLGDIGSSPDSVSCTIDLLIASLAVTGNLIILTIHLVSKNEFRNTFSSLLRNQVICDLLTSFAMILTATIRLPQQMADKTWWDEVVCRIFVTELPLVSLYSASVYNLVAITIEQFVFTVHTNFYLSHTRYFNGRHIISAVWFIAIGLNVCLTIPTSGLSDNNLCLEFSIFPNETIKLLCGLLLSTIYTFLPYALALYLTIRLAIRLRKESMQVGPLNERIIDTTLKHKVASLKIITFFNVAFIVCGSINGFILFLSFFNIFNPEFFSSPLYIYSITALYSCCAINPFIHAISDNKIKHIRRTLSRKFCLSNKANVSENTGRTFVSTEASTNTIAVAVTFTNAIYNETF